MIIGMISVGIRTKNLELIGTIVFGEVCGTSEDKRKSFSQKRVDKVVLRSPLKSIETNRF
jgi:hypothetical protein